MVQYIPVHGGITYAVKDSFAAVWGFDTNHAGSEKVPRSDPDYIRGECFKLYSGLLIAAEMWPRFERANQEKRAEMAQALLDIDVVTASTTPIHERLGFTALLSAMLGKVGE